MSFYDYKDENAFKEENGYLINGIWYPRVTKIVGIKSKPALYRYYGDAKSYKEATAQTQKSAEEGTLIHETIQDIMVGKSPTINPTIRPAVEAYINFAEQRNLHVDPDYIEKRIFNIDHRYAGTIDALALIDGRTGVLDIKTSLGIYRDYNLQTSAYMDAMLKDPTMQHPLQTRWILRIDQQKACARCTATLREKGGRIKIKRPYPMPRGIKTCPASEHEWGPLTGIIELQEFPYWRADFNAFLSAKSLWEWENEEWLKKIGFIK